MCRGLLARCVTSLPGLAVRCWRGHPGKGSSPEKTPLPEKGKTSPEKSGFPEPHPIPPRNGTEVYRNPAILRCCSGGKRPERLAHSCLGCRPLGPRVSRGWRACGWVFGCTASAQWPAVRVCRHASNLLCAWGSCACACVFTAETLCVTGVHALSAFVATASCFLYACFRARRTSCWPISEMLPAGQC